MEKVDFQDFKLWQKVEKCSLEDRKIGEKTLFKKEAAFALLAGGEGTRLGFSGPKGMFQITLQSKKSLFELFAKKLLRIENQYLSSVFFILMVSSKNEKQTKVFFEKHNFFGLDKKQVLFFVQEDLPYLDLKEKVLKDAKNQILQGPSGNGVFFQGLKKSFILDFLKKQKIKYLQVAPVDNPLCEPLDPVFLGFHVKHQRDVSLIALKKEKGLENTGVLVEQNGKLKIIEYLYLKKKLQTNKENIGKSNKIFKENHNSGYVNSALFLFNVSFIEKHKFDLPTYKILKNIIVEKKGKEEKIPVYKQEKFIFDVLDYADQAGVVLYPKEKCFAPLKSPQDLAEIEKKFLQSEDQIYF